MPVIHFTVRTLEALPAPTTTAQIDYWDESLPQFGLRVSSSGRRSWTVMYRLNGRLRRMTLGTFGPAGLGLAEARKQAHEILHQVANGFDPAKIKLDRRRAETYQELSDIYVDWAMGNKSSWKEDQRILNHDILPDWKNTKVYEITRKDVRKLIDKIVNRGARVHANRTFALIRRIFNFAVENDVILYNPCASMKRPCEEKQKDRVLSTEEIRRLWKFLEGHPSVFGFALQFGLLTCQRPGEVRAMKWEQIDLDQRVWTIPTEQSKNSLSHRVPLSAVSIEILKRLKILNSESSWVFPSERLSDGHIYSVMPIMDDARKAVGAHFNPHDLRRTGASHISGLGISRLVVSKILNHAELGVTAVYDRHGYDREKRAALDQWASHLMEIVTSRGSKWADVIQLSV